MTSFQKSWLPLLLAGCIICTTTSCTLVATVSGPFVGGYGKIKGFIKDMNNESLKTIEKVGLGFALPLDLAAGIGEGLIIGPFVGLGMDIEYLSTGKIDLQRLQVPFKDSTSKYKKSEEPLSPKSPSHKKTSPK
ncbi:MAG: hypothetical protein D6785_12750 [Planctomycetota bacterium]|nr:MAG: hypothetical protein D6785_12750 [Planctomycetota bacterium]